MSDFVEDLKRTFSKEKIDKNLNEMKKWVEDATNGKVMMIKFDLDDKEWTVMKEIAKIENKSVQQLTNEAVKKMIKEKSPF